MSACDASSARLTADEAIQLLNDGKVTEIGVSHSGYTILTLEDGSAVGNKAAVIGDPEELLKKCSNCSDVSTWIE